jgi:hypothetical protein
MTACTRIFEMDSQETDKMCCNFLATVHNKQNHFYNVRPFIIYGSLGDVDSCLLLNEVYSA